MSDRPQYDLSFWRGQVPLLERFVPMNHCSQAPLTVRTLSAAEAYLSSWNVDGMDWDRWIGEVDRARAEFARLINASPDEVAVSTSVSAATASVAGALDFSGPRSRVVTTRAEFPTVGHVWLAHEKRGADVAWVPVRDGVIDLGAYGSVLDERTRVLSVCHGYYQTGFKQDLAELARMAHEVGAHLFVDAYQTLGTCPVDVKALDLDFLASGTLKFLMGTAGIAFLYVRPELIEQMETSVTGWFGRENPYAFQVDRLDWAHSARRFETGTPPVMNAWVAREGMAMINEVGTAAIGGWTDVLSRRLIEGGRARGLAILGDVAGRAKAPTTAFRCPGDSHDVEVALRQRGVLASARGTAVRLAPHFYSTEDDVDVALEALAEVIGGG